MANKLNDNPILRWGILLLVGFVLAVNYYFYDAFSSLKSLLTSELGFSNSDYGLFASFYSVPNTFLLMAVLGGVILDRLGIRPTGFMFIFSMTLGAFLTAYGASDVYRAGGLGYEFMNSFLPNYSPELKMMLAGRLLYGLGAETSIVVISKVLVKWFKGKDLALAFGIKVGFGRLGTLLALRMQPQLTNGGADLHPAIWFAAVLTGIGLLVFLVYMLIDLKLDKQTKLENKDMPKAAKEEFKLNDILSLLSNRGFLFIAILCVTFYSAAFPFMQYAPDFFLNKFGVSIEVSGEIASWLPAATAIFTPFFGFFIDRIGKSITVMIYGSIILFLVHISFALTTFSPYVLMVFLGIAFSLVPAAMWPTMVNMVKEKQIGTAYGLMYSIQNLGLFVFPLLAGIILDATNKGNSGALDYTYTILMFAGLGLVGLLFAFLLLGYDKKSGKGINMPLNRK